MKKLYTITLYFILTLIVSIASAQVSKLNYLLEYNAQDSSYAVYIRILEGTSTSPAQRAQFNSQISIVKPTNTKLTFLKMNMPVQGNNAGTLTSPGLTWVYSCDAIAPSIMPNFDFVSIIPTLSPTAFYSKLVPEDEVKLFTFKVTPTPNNPLDVRFFDNIKDPKNFELGTWGMDFSNTFTIGGVQQDYAGNLPSRIINAQPLSTKSIELNEITIYPNPVSNACFIKTNASIQKFEMYDINGKIVLSGTSSFVDCTSLLKGIYVLQVTTSSGKYIEKVVKE